MAPTTPQSVVLAEAPGLAANLNANPSCITGTPQLTGTACQVGTATLTTTLPRRFSAMPASVFLVPPASGSSDFAGLETVFPQASGLQNSYSGLSLRTSSHGGRQPDADFPNVERRAR